MKTKYLFLLFLVLTSISCKKRIDLNELHKPDIKHNGLFIYFNTYAQRYLKININDSVVFDQFAFPDSVFKYTKLEIPTNARDSVEYNFNVAYSDCEHNFYLPAKGLDSLIISEASFFNIEHIEKKQPNQKREFTFYLSKNIANNCNVKIAADSVTLYNGLFLNNYPRRYYNTMKFTYTFSEKKRYVEMYLEIFENFTYFSIDTEKYDAVKVSFDNHLVITTNLDEEWHYNYSE